MTGWRSPCNKALSALPRGLRGVATRAPLHCNKAAAAIPGGPYGCETVAFQDKIGKQKPTVLFALEKP